MLSVSIAAFLNVNYGRIVKIVRLCFGAFYSTRRTSQIFPNAATLIDTSYHSLRKELSLAGIATAKDKGKHLGQKVSLTVGQEQEIKGKYTTGMNPTELSKEFGVSRASICNALKG